MTSSMTFSNKEPYQSIEGNVRVGEHETVMCVGCDAEAVVVSYDGKHGLCEYHLERYQQRLDEGYEYDPE